MCSSCHNVTEDLTGDAENIYYLALPNGMSFNGTLLPISMNMSNLGLLNTDNSSTWEKDPQGNPLPGVTTQDHGMEGFQDLSISMKHIKFVLVDYFVIFGPSAFIPPVGQSPSPPLAIECMIHWCVKTIKTSVKDTILNDIVVDSWASNDTFENDNPYLYPPGQNATFMINSGVTDNLYEFLQRFFQGYGTGRRNMANGPVPFYSSDVAEAILATLTNALTPDRVSKMSELNDNIATGLTNIIRTRSGALNLSEQSPWAIGTAYESQTYVHVRWGWLAFPVTILLLSLSFLVATAYESTGRRIRAWKSNVLPTLLHGFEDESRNGMGFADSMEDMRYIAKNVRVELDVGKEGWRLKEAS